MKKHCICLVLLLCLGLSAIGCNGVTMNSEYATLLDQTVVLSKETSNRADADKLTVDEMKQALRLQADVWKRFQNARDGVAEDE